MAVAGGLEVQADNTGDRETETGARFDVRIIDPFDGTGDVVAWHTQTTLLCEYRGVSVSEVIPMRLKGGAFAVWSQLSAADRRSADAVKNALFAAFAMDDYAAHTAFMSRTLQPGESVDVYLASLRRYADLFGGVTDRQLAAAFVNGLPAAVSDSVRAGARAEKLTLASTLARARAMMGAEQVQAVAAAREERQQQRPQRPTRPRRRCWTCGALDHLAAACPQRPGNASGAPPARALSPGQ